MYAFNRLYIEDGKEAVNPHAVRRPEAECHLFLWLATWRTQHLKRSESENAAAVSVREPMADFET